MPAHALQLRSTCLAAVALLAGLPAQNARLLSDIDPAGSGMYAQVSWDESFQDAYGETWFASSAQLPMQTLYRSDGTTPGTIAVTQIPRAYFRHIRPALGQVFFVNADAQGIELWSSDGTSAGTSIVKDIAPGGANGYGKYYIDAAELRGDLYFEANDQVHGPELWKTDGTVAGTVMVKDILAGAKHYGPIGFIRLGPHVCFMAGPSDRTRDLWRTNGTATGTIKIATLNAYHFQSPPVRFGNRRIAFISRSNHASELWVSDGTAAGSSMIRPFTQGTPRIIDVDSKGLYIHQQLSSKGGELWYSDGTAAGTNRIATTASPTPYFARTEGRILNGKLYFAFETPSNGKELWVSDGTTPGTKRLVDLRSGPASSTPYSFVRTGDRYLHFIADLGAGWRVFRTDGTVAGTVPVGGSTPPVGRLTFSGGKLFFIGDHPAVRMEPFVLDLPANSKSIGTGCAESRRPAVLTATTDPILGRPLWLQLDRGPSSRLGALVFGSLAPMGNTVLGATGCALYVDPSLPVLTLFFSTDRDGQASWIVPVPSTGSLNGARVAAQAVMGPTSQGPLGLDLSPGLLLSLGR